MVRIKDLPKHKRPREKLLEKGAENLSDEELLAILIRTGRAGKSALDIAKSLLKKYSLSKLSMISIKDLLTINGIENTKAVTIEAALELGQRAIKLFDSSLPILDCPKAIVDQLSDLRKKKKEYFVALYLNARNQLVRRETISIGTLTASLVHPREVMQPAIACFASSIIVAHNHPSNSPKPSKEDILLTENLVRSGKILDIELLDHIIVTNRDYFSFKQKGMIYVEE